jgi:hypothetical protein
MKKMGILVGSDARQEWLLPWWWENFRRHNQYPVSFVDFGLSQEKKAWCRERGELIALRTPPLFVKDREEVCGALAEGWESHYPDTFWASREAWFKKPLACLQSPYERTIWCDLDCEVVQPLDGLMRACDDVSGIALAKDFSSQEMYNSGVIVFQKNHPLIQEWAKQSIEKNGLFRGDQDLLSQIIAEKGLSICELSPIYNWSVGFGKREDVVIYHWLGDAAKSALRNSLIFSDLTFL